MLIDVIKEQCAWHPEFGLPFVSLLILSFHGTFCLGEVFIACQIEQSKGELMIFLNFRTENTRESAWYVLAISLDTTWQYFRFQSTPKKTVKGVWKQLNNSTAKLLVFLFPLSKRFARKRIFIYTLICYPKQIFRAWLHVTLQQTDGNARRLPVMPGCPA